MELQSGDGASISLAVVSYQLPSPSPSTTGPDFDSDANWLVIDAIVTDAQGRQHNFTDPCLLTSEADELGGWLRAVGLGRIPATVKPTEDQGLLVFMEPNLAFSVSSWTPESATIRVHLSLEATPPWAEPEAELFETFVALQLTPEGLFKAAEEWSKDRTPYPPR